MNVSSELRAEWWENRWTGRRITLGGRPAAWQPVLGEATYPAPWQAWRVALEPCAEPRPFRLEITAASSSHAEPNCRGFFVAQ